MISSAKNTNDIGFEHVLEMAFLLVISGFSSGNVFNGIFLLIQNFES